MSWINPSFSQEAKISVEQGYAITTTNSAKRIMLHHGAEAGMEWRINEKIMLSAGLSGYTLQAGYSLFDGNRYEKRFFLQVPVTAEKVYPLSKHSNGYVEAGVYVTRNISSGIISRLNGTVIPERQRNAGWNAGIQFGIGFETGITQRLSFSIGLRGRQDYWQKYIPGWGIKIHSTSLVLCFYRKLKL